MTVDPSRRRAEQIADMVEGVEMAFSPPVGADDPYPPDEEEGRRGNVPPLEIEPEIGFVDEPTPPSGHGPADGGPVLAACAQERQNDTGNARRFRLRFGDLSKAQMVVHVQNIGWFCWDGRRWREDGDDRVIRPLAQECADLISRETLLITPTPDEDEALGAAISAEEKAESLEASLAALGDDDGDKKAKIKKAIAALSRIVAHGNAIEKRILRRRSDRLRHANSSGNKGKLDGMLNEARPFVSRQLASFDTSDLDFNVENGTLFFGPRQEIDLECPDPDVTRYVTRWAVGIKPHDRHDFNTKLAPVFWCPDAKAAHFAAFIERVLPNEAVRRYVQRFFGYCLTRRTSEQMFCIFFGGGRNGKSTLVDIVARILDDYATSVPIGSLMAENARKAQDATPDLNRLPGARFVRTSEPKEGLALNEGLVKELTGGEPIHLRRLNQESIEVYPEFKLVISCNYKPRILGNDDGIWRRIALVPFNVQIPKEEVDKKLGDTLWAERSGILNWMVDGAIEYLEMGGLSPPREILEATDEYRLSEDPIGKYIMTALDVTRDPKDVIESGRLYQSFVLYAKRFNEPVLGDAAFRRKMPKGADDHGFAKGKSSISIYTGVRFKPGFSPPDEPSHTQGWGRD